MRLKIFNDADNMVFPEDFEDQPAPWERTDIKKVKVDIDPNSLMTDLMWDLMGRITLRGGEMWDACVNETFFPAFGLKRCERNSELLPYLKTIKELGLLSEKGLVLGTLVGGTEELLEKEFNAMREHDEKLLDRVFRWTPEKLDMLVDRTVELNELDENVKGRTEVIIKGTGITWDEAGKKRYMEAFERTALYQVVAATVEPSRQMFKEEKNYFWLYLISKLEKRCNDGLKEIVKELSSFTKKDVEWLADKGYLGKVKR